MLPTIPSSIRVPDIWFGVSIAAYQNEDPACTLGAADCFQTDWDIAVAAGRIPSAKGDGTFAYSQTERDIAALKSLGVSHYRLGVEWARVEPQPGVFNDAAIAHYANLCRRLREEGIESVVCIWHWTFPDWLTNLDNPALHGWLHPDAAAHWAQYVQRITAAVSPYCDLFAPQNEPNIQTLGGYVVGVFPPNATLRFDLVDLNVAASADAFLSAARIIRDTHSANAPAGAAAATILSIDIRTVWRQDPVDVFGLIINALRNQSYQHLDLVIDQVDLVGFTYYGRQEASVSGTLDRTPREGLDYSDAGIEIYPAGLTQVIGETFARYGKPMAVMENGIADARDDRRPAYILRHIAAVQDAIDKGWPVVGYFYWSLVDNYEWQDGYRPQFGLYTLDPDTLALVPKASAELYRGIVAARGGVYSP